MHMHKKTTSNAKLDIRVVAQIIVEESWKHVRVLNVAIYLRTALY